MRTTSTTEATAKVTAGDRAERPVVLLTKIGLALGALAALCSLALRIAESIAS